MLHACSEGSSVGENGDQLARYLVPSVGRRLHAGCTVIIIRFNVKIAVRNVWAVNLEFGHFSFCFVIFYNNLTCNIHEEERKGHEMS